MDISNLVVDNVAQNEQSNNNIPINKENSFLRFFFLHALKILRIGN